MFDQTSAKKGMLQEIIEMAREARAKQLGGKVRGSAGGGSKLPDPAADATSPDSPGEDTNPGEDKPEGLQLDSVKVLGKGDPAAMPADGEANPELLAKLLELLTSKGV